VAVLPIGLHPEEIVATIIFAWAVLLFIEVRIQKIKTSKGTKDNYYLFWLVGLVLWVASTFLDVLDNIPGLRMLDSCEHIIFLIGTASFTLGIYTFYRKYGV